MSPFVTKTFTTFKEAEAYIDGVNVIIGLYFSYIYCIIGNIQPESPKGYSVTISRY